MKKILFGSVNTGWTSLLLRLALGGVMLPHGAQKVLGWYGGYGFTATMNAFTTGMHIPAPLAFLAIAAESLGALALILGFLTRFAALGLLANMAVAIATVHFKYGLFMNWTGQQKGEGFEYHILAGGIALVLVITGGGKLSIDSSLAGGGASRPSK